MDREGLQRGDSVGAHFTEAAVKFLRDLKKNNDRTWFEERKDLYERELKAPLLAVVDEVNASLAEFAPEFVRPANKCAMRIYRDVRFSKNKDPYKTNLAAWWARQGLEKTSGGGFYFHFSPEEVMVAAGCYMPEKEQLLAIRRLLLERHGDYRRIVDGRKVKATFEPFDGLKMTRPPQGFPADHPAIDLIMQKQWGLHAPLPLETALGPGLVKAIVDRFKLALPLVTLLNEPLTGKPAKPIF
jgi:uncharacterized protein (TIGR02453 family)